ncbi:MAG TPA: hypothetical protein VJQ43_03285, partial [Thermoplasmata archaeon]|nr:hypothetical protein [Thermoplasmata archaeon]
MARGSIPDRLTRAYGVAYDSDVKAIVGVRDGSVRAFRRGEDEQETLADLSAPEVARATAAAKEVVEEIRRAMEGSVDSSVEDRLKSWGYL